jgi:N-acetyltransferase
MCPSCSLSYTKGAVDDEALHKKHCARVQRGLEWGKEEEKEAHKAGVRVIEDLVRIQGPTGATHGRIIAIPADVRGKIGLKVCICYVKCVSTSILISCV